MPRASGCFVRPSGKFHVNGFGKGVDIFLPRGRVAISDRVLELAKKIAQPAQASLLVQERRCFGGFWGWLHNGLTDKPRQAAG